MVLLAWEELLVGLIDRFDKVFLFLQDLNLSSFFYRVGVVRGLGFGSLGV